MRDATVTFDWADGTYSFRLAWGQLAELQEKCDAGPYVVLQRLHSGEWRIEDVSNIIRLGLIGGGMEPAPALKLTRAYVEARPPMENIIPAQVILSAALTGAPEEKVGEGDAANQKTDSLTNSQTES
jgi:hypothetical protein